MDIGSLIGYPVGTVLSLALFDYDLRTLKLFKVNAARRAWTYISISPVFFGVGVVTVLVEALAPMGLVAVGSIMQAVGAFFSSWDSGRTLSSEPAKTTSPKNECLIVLLLDRIFYI